MWLVVAILLFAGLTYLLFEKIASAPYVYVFLALWAVKGNSDLTRNDFLKNLYPRRAYYRIRLAENLLISLPFAPYLLYKGFVLLALGLQLGSVILAFISWRKPFDFAVPTPFFRFPFEFIAGFRRTWLVIGAAYALTYIALKYNNFNLGVFALVVILVDCIAFMLKAEEYYFVWVFSMNAQCFLWHKIKAAVICTFILCLPVLVALGLFYPGNIQTVLGVEIWGSVLVVMAMLSKYSAYPGDLSTTKGVLLGVALMFPALVLYTIPAFYLEARKQLRMILE